jgi:hypothetical protein
MPEGIEKIRTFYTLRIGAKAVHSQAIPDRSLFKNMVFILMFGCAVD